MAAVIELNEEEMALKETEDIQARSLRRMDYNMYATKKSAAQSMLDVALLMANSSQLKTLLYVGPQYRFYIPLIVLLALSMTLQVVVGLLLVFIAKYNLNDERKHPKLERMNNAATVFVFFTVLINIFITALGFQGSTVRWALSEYKHQALFIFFLTSFFPLPAPHRQPPFKCLYQTSSPFLLT
ncbi:ninjurin-2 isoform X3 [Oryzias melastigma]|uniref:ninjurin-2 isoform X3 n=1 Tax=Oryzias melastigma TaxID=30732 RepID=UPI00168D5490|nr:ninjurin-2 isoform X3 [Oryzias melastigma]